MSHLLRSITKKGFIRTKLSTGAARQIVQRYGALVGVPDLNPHDLRRTLAKQARKGGAEIETIQRTLGHSSVRTTELYLGAGEDANAGDFLELGGSL